MEFRAQMLESLSEEVKHVWYHEPGAWRPDISSIRDEQMGRDLLWLLEHGFPGRKVIVWPATLHVARHVEDLEIVNSSLTYDGCTTMGQVVREGISTDGYTVGFTAGGGQVGRWNDVPVPWTPHARAVWRTFSSALAPRMPFWISGPSRLEASGWSRFS